MDFAELARVGAEPSPTHLGAFVVEHLERVRSARRSELITAAEGEWARVAGAPMKTPIVPRMKKALQMLAEQGSIRATGAYGVWTLAEAIPDFVEAEELATVSIDGDGPSEGSADDDQSGLADRTVGRGSQQVYCFYLDAYRDLAAAREEVAWPIKIGMTAGQLSSRMDAHRTALPEAPHLALVIRTDNAATLEKVLHGVLTLRGKRTEGTGGTEWFTTTPDEIESIYRVVLGDAEE